VSKADRKIDRKIRNEKEMVRGALGLKHGVCLMEVQVMMMLSGQG
jgi:hypothetical protein